MLRLSPETESKLKVLVSEIDKKKQRINVQNSTRSRLKFKCSMFNWLALRQQYLAFVLSLQLLRHGWV